MRRESQTGQKGLEGQRKDGDIGDAGCKTGVVASHDVTVCWLHSLAIIKGIASKYPNQQISQVVEFSINLATASASDIKGAQREFSIGDEVME